MNKDNDSSVDVGKVVEDAKKTPFYLKLTLGNLLAILAFLIWAGLYLDEIRDTYLNKIDTLETKVAKLDGLEEKVKKLEDPQYLMEILRRNNGIDFTVFRSLGNNCDSIRHYRGEINFLYEQNNCR